MDNDRRSALPGSLIPTFRPMLCRQICHIKPLRPKILPIGMEMPPHGHLIYPPLRDCGLFTTESVLGWRWRSRCLWKRISENCPSICFRLQQQRLLFTAGLAR
ncbi:hypothetical protein TNCT_370061 [Trichonephila clavata]|uniref:Uncharacterized protein n=1 Tax=Trichonephila clavata TaxID=2740835 RepID=A0A8X6M2M2_TRICU|nr:hypothetical protein TNCT_370061 [Trichonephila clavata]